MSDADDVGRLLIAGDDAGVELTVLREHFSDAVVCGSDPASWPSAEADAGFTTILLSTGTGDPASVGPRMRAAGRLLRPDGRVALAGRAGAAIDVDSVAWSAALEGYEFHGVRDFGTQPCVLLTPGDSVGDATPALVLGALLGLSHAGGEDRSATTAAPRRRLRSVPAVSDMLPRPQSAAVLPYPGRPRPGKQRRGARSGRRAAAMNTAKRTLRWFRTARPARRLAAVLGIAVVVGLLVALAVWLVGVEVVLLLNLLAVTALLALSIARQERWNRNHKRRLGRILGSLDETRTALAAVTEDYRTVMSDFDQQSDALGTVVADTAIYEASARERELRRGLA